MHLLIALFKKPAYFAPAAVIKFAHSSAVHFLEEFSKSFEKDQ